MDYFKINYNKLENMPQIKFYKIIFIFLSLLIILFIMSFYIKVDKKLECYGIINNNVLKIKINNELSDSFKSLEYIIFNDKKIKFKINNYGNYEIINNEIYQEIELIVDEKFYDNEIGLVEFYYDKKILFKYILDLFK